MNLRLPAALPVVMTAFVALIAVAQAQTPSPAPSSSAPAMSAPSPNAPAISAPANPASGRIAKADQRFATTAAQAGTAEIADAKLALQNASRQDVKDFAQKMVDDHTKAADQLKAIAGGENITLPSDESAADQKNTDALQKLNGAAFDKKYIQGQRKAHKQAVALFTKESQKGKDDQLKTFAGQTLPTLQGHLQMITTMPLTQKSASK
jgi:putative membrane protein